MVRWSPGGYRSGSRLPAAAKADRERVGRVQHLIAEPYINPEGDEGPEFRPPPRKKMQVEDWCFPRKKDGSRREGTYNRVVRRFRGKFCLPETPAEKAAFIREVKRIHALPRPRRT